MTPYSLSEHLANALWFSRWREGWFGVFTVYFDASGFEGTKFVSVAGFIAPTEVWNDFETAWLKRLTDDEVFGEDGLPEFHMSACANYRYAFETWRGLESKRQNLLRDLMEILKKLSRKVCCVLNVPECRTRLDERLRDSFNCSAAYVIGGRGCAARVNEWCRKDGSPPLSRVQFIFEQGDGREIQADLRTRFLEDGYPEPIFKRKRNRYKNGTLVEERLIPFQAADILAYLTYLEAKFAGRSWGDKDGLRWMLQELSNIPEQCVQFSEFLGPFNSWMRACSHNLLGPNRMS